MEAEVCVVGGGPAGSVVARRLARLGHQVCLIERRAFPRPHVGESLPPGILPLLEVAEVRERVERAGFLRPNHALIQWSEGRPRERSFGPLQGFQVDRGRFDQLLLQAAADAGVRVLQPASAKRPTREASGRWRIPLRGPGGPLSLRAKFLVDASGRNMTLRGDRPRTAPGTLALYSYWKHVPWSGCETRVEAGPRAWYWGAPLPDGTFNVMVFLTPEELRRHSRADLDAVYREHLSRSNLLSVCLRGTALHRARACDAGCRAAVDMIGPDWIRVGEAAFTIDPLSSQGVQTAIKSALQGAVAVHTLLIAPEHRPAALQFFQHRQTEAVERHREFSRQMFAELESRFQDGFWQNAAGHSPSPAEQPAPRRLPPKTSLGSLSPSRSLRLVEEAGLRPTPVMEGNLIRERPALWHASLRRPVAYLEGVAADRLLRPLKTQAMCTDVLADWSELVPAETGWKILTWMWRHGLVVAAG